MHVLVVEDDESVASSVMEGLATANLGATLVGSGTEALRSFAELSPDIVLLDLGLPDMDGTDVCRSIRSTSSTPIIILSARDDEIDRVVALEIGADDYLVKPFGMRELIARIRAVVRRSSTVEPESTKSLRNYGPLSIDSRSRRVTLAEVEIYFTPKEFDLLDYLSRDAGAVLRRAEILRNVWETNWYGTTKTLDAHVAAIRRKLGDPGWIVSVRGIGFRFGLPE
ncbi:MAG: response regulator transcription factor [Salinibacterium sp.]|nr:response regulator transcription factor [Salinibacterium sp.]